MRGEMKDDDAHHTEVSACATNCCTLHIPLFLADDSGYLGSVILWLAM